ncbi:MAG TPA: NUDIX hydrolase [Acidimicrobiales bacterium]|nr:NUDIX hydrolase [Acidimicrobiales bacterium]
MTAVPSRSQTGDGEPASREASQPVRAAGGIVWRHVPAGTEIVLVHRPAYDDWAFPKGKLRLGESDDVGALREVKEETGLDCRLGPELPTTTYPVEGRLKSVRYWAMTVDARSGRVSEQLAPTEEGKSEVDRAQWLALDLARQRLSYPRDVVVLDSLEQSVPIAGASEVRRQEDDSVLKSEPERQQAEHRSP